MQAHRGDQTTNMLRSSSSKSLILVLEVIAVRANYYRGAKMYTSFVVSFKAWLQSEKEEQAHSIQLSFCRALIADTSAHSITKSIL